MRKTFFLFGVLFLLIVSCKDKSVNPIDNGLVGNWKMESVTNSNGTVITNTTTKEVITTFYEDSNKFNFVGSGTGGGRYTLSKNNGMTISVGRLDLGGWPNGVWLDLYLDAMNSAKAYTLSSSQLIIKTTDERTILFTKL